MSLTERLFFLALAVSPTNVILYYSLERLASRSIAILSLPRHASVSALQCATFFGSSLPLALIFHNATYHARLCSFYFSYSTPDAPSSVTVLLHFAPLMLFSRHARWLSSNWYFAQQFVPELLGLVKSALRQ